MQFGHSPKKTHTIILLSNKDKYAHILTHSTQQNTWKAPISTRLSHQPCKQNTLEHCWTIVVGCGLWNTFLLCCHNGCWWLCDENNIYTVVPHTWAVWQILDSSAASWPAQVCHDWNSLYRPGHCPPSVTTQEYGTRRYFMLRISASQIRGMEMAYWVMNSLMILCIDFSQPILFS